MNLSDAHKKSSELSRMYPGRKWAVVKAFTQVGGPYWSEEYSALIAPTDLVAVYAGGEQEPSKDCQNCGHPNSEHHSVAGGTALACRRMGCDCVNPAPAGGEARP